MRVEHTRKMGLSSDAIEHRRWKIGTHPGEIKPEDVVLLGVVFVSPGAIMPVLKLRSDFRTCLW